MGGLKHRRVKRKRIKRYKALYANENYPERCLVHLCKYYVKKCPTEALRGMFSMWQSRKYSESDEGMFSLMILKQLYIIP
jgi:ferredoxin